MNATKPLSFLHRFGALLAILTIISCGPACAQEALPKLTGTFSYSIWNTAKVGGMYQVGNQLALCAGAGYAIPLKKGGHFSWGPAGPISAFTRHMAYSGPVAELGIAINRRESGTRATQLRLMFEYENLKGKHFIEDDGLLSGSSTSPYAEFNESLQSYGFMIQNAFALRSQLLFFVGGGFRHQQGTRAITRSGLFNGIVERNPPLEEFVQRTRLVVQVGLVLTVPRFYNN